MKKLAIVLVVIGLFVTPSVFAAQPGNLITFEQTVDLALIPGLLGTPTIPGPGDPAIRGFSFHSATATSYPPHIPGLLWGIGLKGEIFKDGSAVESCRVTGKAGNGAIGRLTCRANMAWEYCPAAAGTYYAKNTASSGLTLLLLDDYEIALSAPEVGDCCV